MKVEDIVYYIGDERSRAVPETKDTPGEPARFLFGSEAIIVAVNDPAVSPGKHIGLCMAKPYGGGHSCDGLVPEGHGRWSKPDELVTPDEFARIVRRLEQQAAAKKVAQPLAAKYLAQKATEEKAAQK